MVRAVADAINPVREEGLMYTGGENGCTDYPTLADGSSEPSERPEAPEHENAPSGRV
ncbi:hypothetical protein [Streptomyces sp. NPDC086147]|uniref:hypothetical protein n=1 Tax=unclassified Streptomyces TaxID=2593676 RepID=UPI00344C1E43